MVPKLSRRTFLAGGLSAAALTGVGGFALVPGGVHEAVATTLRRLLGDVRIGPAELRRFTSDYQLLLQERGVSAATVRAVGALDGMLGQPWLRGLLPARVDAQIQRYERHLVTQFTLGTTFFAVADPYREEIVCTGPAERCGNPFARFA